MESAAVAEETRQVESLADSVVRAVACRMSSELDVEQNIAHELLKDLQMPARVCRYLVSSKQFRKGEIVVSNLPLINGTVPVKQHAFSSDQTDTAWFQCPDLWSEDWNVPAEYRLKAATYCEHSVVTSMVQMLEKGQSGHTWKFGTRYLLTSMSDRLEQYKADMRYVDAAANESRWMEELAERQSADAAALRSRVLSWNDGYSGGQTEVASASMTGDPGHSGHSCDSNRSRCSESRPRTPHSSSLDTGTY
jgi:hypothetical protein